ncbi:NusA-like transcription termination signal-binding factor [Candidatus Bathyarchaeota archaeon]|nr:MAG: NusA-like transcription termination signal-binding factor [Candidatus Bathyarchaeota archaeon]
MTQKIRLTSDEMSYIALFENVTGAVATDCIIDEERNRIIFVVKPGDVGLAIGKHGSRIKLVKNMVQKDIEIVEYADNPEAFIRNSFAPARIKEIRITNRLDNKKVAVVMVENKDKGIAIGKSGKTAERTRFLAKRYFQIDNVVIR